MQLIESVRVFAERLEREGPGAVRDALGRDFFGHSPGEGEAGAADRIGDLVDDLAEAIPDLTLRLIDLAESGEGVKARLDLSGTHSAGLWGAPATGEILEWSTPVTIRGLDDGLAIRVDDFDPVELVGLLRRLGVVNPADQMDVPVQNPVAVPEFMLKLMLTGEAGDRPCSHLDMIQRTMPTTDVCEQCVASGDIWPALRMCLFCGFVGCCDTSVNRHMRAHYATTGHPLFRSIRPGEAWVWCYEDDAFLESSILG